MIKILFICHGNICRSPMAEFVMKDMVEREGMTGQFLIGSAATSTEEIGNPVHYGTREKLRESGIDTSGKRAVQLKRSDYDKYDYLIGMDQWNMRQMERILGRDTDGKMFRLLDFTHSPGDIADPWYTGDFDATYRDVMRGCGALLDYIKLRGK